MPFSVEALLGPLGLVVGCLVVIWGFLTERVVSGVAYRRLLEQNEALLRRVDRALSVTGRAVDVADKTETK